MTYLLLFFAFFSTIVQGRRFLVETNGPVTKGTLYSLFSGIEIDTLYPLWQGPPICAPKSLRNSYVLITKSPIGVNNLINAAKKGVVGHIEPDYPIELFEDSLFNQEWGLNNIGQPHWAVQRNPECYDDSLILVSGNEDSDIDAPEAWSFEEAADRETVLVGVLDSGCDSTHPDLQGAIFRNKGEIPNNGIDDDNNGFVDDYWGWDFSGDSALIVPSQDNDPTDQHGHGTHVSGIIASRENGIGTVGVARYSKILPIKIFPNATVSVAVQGILYAVLMGAKVINASWGSPYRSTILEEAIDYAKRQGVIFSVAAGNSGETDDPSIFFPASSPLTIAVGASDHFDRRAPFSSYGEELDLLAPGSAIVSLRAEGTDMYGEGPCPEPGVHIIDENWYIASGTSMAAPFVSGAIAVMEGVSYGMDPDLVKDLLLGSADDLTDPNGDGSYYPGWDIYSGYGRVNLYNALSEVPKLRVKIKEPRRGKILWGNIDIQGTVEGQDFTEYRVEIGEGEDPNLWDTLFESTNPVHNDLILSWDSSPFVGIYTIRITSPPQHEDRITLYLVNEDLAQITKPSEGDTVSSYVEVKGTASQIGFNCYSMLVKKIGTNKWDTLYQSTFPVFQNTLALWHIPDTLYGDFLIRLVVNGSNGQLEDTALVHVKRGGVEGFPAYFSGYPSITPRVSDIDKDGKMDIVVTSSEGVYSFDNHGNLKEGWPFQSDMDFRSIAAIWDVDGDGYNEVIATASSLEEAKVYVLNQSGQIKNGWPHTTPPALFLFGVAPPVIADINKDGMPEILQATLNGVLYAWEGDGSSYIEGNEGIFASATGAIFGQTEPTIVVADINGDNRNEVAVTWAHPSWPHGGLWIWKDDATPLSGYYGSFWSFEYISGMVGCDVDGDGITDLVIAGAEADSFGIWVIRGDSTLVPGWPKKLDLEREQWLLSPPVTGDIDQDGHPEILISANSLSEGRIYIWRHDGTPYSDPYMTGNGLFITMPKDISAPLLVDLTDDSLPEIVVRTNPFISSPEEVWAFDTTGNLLPGWPFVTGATFSMWSIRSPTFEDITGDGKQELLLSGYNGGLYAWYTTAGKGIWPTFLHDNANSSLMYGPDFPNVSERQRTAMFKILPPRPNPTKNTTQFWLTLSKPQKTEISVFDVSGRLIKRIFKGDLESGNHLFKWNAIDSNGKGVSSGVYFIKIKSQDLQEVKPLVIIR